MTGVIELYEDRQSGWRVLTSRGGTVGYRFIIVDRAGRSTFAADATELSRGRVPAGLEHVDLDGDSPHGMVLIEPCALWSRSGVQRTQAKPGVLTAAYISGEVGANGDQTESHVISVGIGDRQALEAELLPPAGTRMSETLLASNAIVPVHPLRGQHMPRTSANGSTTRRRRRTGQGLDARLFVTQITRLVAANEQLQRANRQLSEENERLRGELTTIGSALGSVTGARRGRGRGGAAALTLRPEARPPRQRRPITDPEVLARRNAALAKARAARAEKLAAARAGAKTRG